MRYIKVGYDRYPEYSVEELKAMYLQEGKPEDEAAKLAEELHISLHAMIADERYRWRKAWKLHKQLPEPVNESEDSND
jgi:hypothetical protein